MELYGNQNRMVNRDRDAFKKVASPYDEQRVFNRKQKPVLKLASLSVMDGEEVCSLIQKEAQILDKEDIQKTASANPFELFGNTKHYVTKKLGLSDTSAHDVAGSVIGKAQQISDQYGGEISEVAAGIVDQMDPRAFPEVATGLVHRTMSNHEQDAFAKQLLMDEMQMSSYDADRYKKSVVATARSFYTKFRTKGPQEIISAVVSILVERRDVTLIFDMTNNDQLKREIEMKLI